MLTVSNELKNAFMQAERTIFVRIKIGNRTFDNDNVVSVEYDSGSLSGEVFAIGSTYSNSIKITFSELVEGLKELDEVTYEIGIKLADGKIIYVPMGVFIINDAIEMDRNNNKTTIECMDRMVMMGGAYASSLTYPAAIREVALEIANKAGVSVDVTSFERLSADKIAKPEGYTFREAIGLIAQFEAGFATFNRYGKLEIRTLSDPNFAIPPDNYFSKGLVKNEVFFRLGGISCTTDESGDAVIQSGNSTGNQIVLENRVMTKVLLDKIYQKIQTINYYPFSLSWQGNPVLEAGDWVEVEDLKGNKFKTPNLSYSLSFNGGLSAKSSAETATQSDTTYQYKSPLQQKIEWIHARIDAAGGNVVYEGIDEPANPKEGDLWFKIIGPDKEILIYKKRADGSLFWEPQISTADIDKVAEKVEEAIKQVEEVEKSANAAVAKADQAIKDAGFAQVDANAAKVNATNALTAANAAKVDSASALTKANTAITDSSKALTNANSALTRVGSVEVTTGELSTSYDALTRTVGLKADQTTVDGIKGTVATQELAISANATSIGLKADKSVVDTINGTVTKHTADIKANSDGLKLKADSSVVSTLSGTVATHTTQIKAASDGLALKADSTLVNTIKGTVDTHTTQIKATSDGLALKADSSLVNSIKGTVDTHSTQISANSQAISARLTSAQVETILTGKKYVNETTLNATANGLSASITKVSSDLEGLEIGGTNLIPNTKTMGAGITVAGVISGEYQGLSIAKSTRGTTGSLDTFVTRTTGIPTETTYTASFFAKANVNTPINCFFYSPNTTTSSKNSTGHTSTGSDGNSTLNITTEWKRYWVTWTQTIPTGTKSIIIGRNQNVSGAIVEIAGVKFETGNKNTPWSPAPEDMATVEQFTTIDATVKGLQTTVGNKAEQSQVTQLAGQVSSKVESATYNSKMTQLDSAINLRVQKGDVIGQINVEAGKTLIQNKSLYLDAATVTFSGKAFIPSAAISSLTVDKLNGGTANFANFNAININVSSLVGNITNFVQSNWNDANSSIGINASGLTSTAGSLSTTLNAGQITTKSGTKSGTVNAFGMQIYDSANGQTTRLYSDGLEFQWYDVIRRITQTSEGLKIKPETGSANRLNSSLELETGPGNDKVAYLQFAIPGAGSNARLQLARNVLSLRHPNGGKLDISDYAYNGANGLINSGTFRTSPTDGAYMEMTGKQLQTVRTGNHNIYIMPAGTGGVTIGSGGSTRWPITALRFVESSNRASKTNILPYSDSGLAAVNSLTVTTYNRVDELARGNMKRDIGFIAEDSPIIRYDQPDGTPGVDNYQLSAYLVKAVQEVDRKIITEVDLLKAEVNKLKQKIEKLESAA